jgi:archaellum component FlaC
MIFFQNQTNDINKEIRTKEHLEQELKMLSTSFQDRDSEARNLKHQLSQAELNIGKLETNVKDLKVLKVKQRNNKTEFTNAFM